MIERRTFMIGVAAVGTLGACGGPAGPGAVAVVAQGAAGMNPGPDGADRPLTLQIVQMRSAGAFDTADFFALQDPATALGADFIKADQIALAAGASVSRSIALDPAVTAIGVVAGFRDPTGKAFRAKTSVSPTAQLSLRVDVGSGGIQLTPG